MQTPLGIRVSGQRPEPSEGYGLDLSWTYASHPVLALPPPAVGLPVGLPVDASGATRWAPAASLEWRTGAPNKSGLQQKSAIPPTVRAHNHLRIRYRHFCPNRYSDLSEYHGVEGGCDGCGAVGVSPLGADPSRGRVPARARGGGWFCGGGPSEGEVRSHAVMRVKANQLGRRAWQSGRRAGHSRAR